jgi:hypothetical protein
MSALEDVRRIAERIATVSAAGDFAPFIAAPDDDHLSSHERLSWQDTSSAQ